MTLSMILKWYGVDFGRTVPARLRYISQFLPDERRAALRRMLDGPGGGSSIKVSYSPYDWGVNSKE